MSTLGGSRGERNAKPKFAALDINRLYHNSRGESVDTATQKNQVPRIHGMQSLGKVPSARRPPANLPSLKAEVKSPGIIAKSGQDGTNQSVASGTSGINSVNTSSSSTNSNHINSNTNNNYQSSDRHSSLTHSHSSHHSTSLNNSSSVTWSSVTTGQDVGSGNSLPPLYQSPQFQHEFPSLDGSIPGSGSHKLSAHQHQKDAHSQQQQNSNTRDGSAENGNQQHGGDMSQVSLRPQTDAASWNQQGGKCGGDTAHGKQQGPDHHQAVPQPMRALMPSFVYRGNMGPPDAVMSSGARSLTPPNQQNGNFPANIGRSHQRSMPHTENKDYRSSSPSTGIIYRNTGVQKRPPSLNTPPSNRGGSRDREAAPFTEPDVAIIQRPIIKEEDLERMNAISKDDGWTQQDEIDYNQKLAFSDDESPENTPAIERDRLSFTKPADKRSSSWQQQQQTQPSQQGQSQKQDQDDRNAWPRPRDNEKERKDKENVDKERNERERENESRDNRQAQQNGHRASGLDAAVYERAKQRKEMEEKLEFERKQAAAKKLQELELKMNTKKSSEGDSGHEDNRPKEDDYNSQNRRQFKDGRDYARYDKYERDSHRDNNYSGNQGRNSQINQPTNKPFFGNHGGQYQSNLPPRFLKQQQAASAQGGVVAPAPGASTNPNARSITATQQSHNYHAGSADTREKSNVPFAQQYDPRYIHSQNYKQQQQQSQLRRDSYNRPNQGFNRNRNEHGDLDDERYGRSNRDRDYEHSGRAGNQLSRSISDSSQRKTSVSSNDEQKFGEPQRSDSRDFCQVGSWAEEAESESKRQRNVSISSNHSRNDDEIQVKILQRPQTKSISESSTKNEKIEESEEKMDEQEESLKPEETFAPTQILRRSESPKVWSEAPGLNEDSKESSHETIQTVPETSPPTVDTNKTESDPVKNVEINQKEIESINEIANKDKIEDSFGKAQRDQKRPSPRSGVNAANIGRQDMRGPPARGYNSYRGNPNTGSGSWGRRGGGNIRPGGGRHYNNEWSESENSEDVGEDDYHRRSNRSPKTSRKDNPREGVRDHRNPSHVQSNKEGFAPRGEPSRRGRGGSMTASTTSFRRGGSVSNAGPRRMDSYNSSNSKYLSEDDKDKKDMQSCEESTTDDNKAKQNALNSALKKPEQTFDEKNKVKAVAGHVSSPPKRDEKKGSPPKNFNTSPYQNNRKESTSNSKNEEPRKEEADGDRRKSASKEKEISASSGQQQQQRSSSFGQISITRTAGGATNATSGQTSHIKNDVRQGQKAPMTKPPPGLGFKSNSNLNQIPQGSQPCKDQGLQKSKSSSDTRTPNPSINNKTNPPRLNKQWDTNRRDTRREEGNSSWDKTAQEKADGITENTQPIVTNQGETKVKLDGTTPPVNTIIFENTNYKTSVQASNQIKRQISNQSDSAQTGNQNLKKIDDSFNKPQGGNTQSDVQHIQHHSAEAITTALSQMNFNKQQAEVPEYDKDIKIGFGFDTEFALAEEKNVPPTAGSASAAVTSKSVLCLPRSSGVMQHAPVSGGQNTISPSTADLNMKIASVKKVWESAPPMQTVLEHTNVPANEAEAHMNATYVQSQPHLQHFAVAAAAAAHSGNIHMQHALAASGPQSYGNTFDPTLEQHFVQKDSSGNTVGVSNQNEEVQVGYSPSPQHVGPNQQGQQNIGVKHPNEVLSNSNAGNVCKGKSAQQMHQSGLGLSPPPNMQQQHQQQQSHTQMHQAAAPQTFYQASQFTGIPTIPSPPTVLFNSPAMPSQGGLYPFQLEPGRSQFSQYPPHYGTTGSGPYNAYTMQTPPNMATAPAPEMYSNLSSQFRMGGAVQSPFNQNQPLNNPNTVLISSSSNSLMSASVKPSSQQIGAIGSKNNAAAVAGQAYGQQYMGLYQPQQAPPQLSSNSYYSNSAAGQGAFFGGPSGGVAGASQSYSIQAAAGMFGGHGGPTPANGPTQQQIAGYNSQFMNSPLLPAAAINQYRGAPTQQTAQAYMKSQGQNHMQDSMGRQLKSPLGADVSLNIAKQIQPQQSPPHHKNYAQSWDMNQVMQQQSQQAPPQQQNIRGGPQNNMNPGGRPGQGPQRYPTPIQRPTNYPQHPQSQPPPQSQRQMRQPPHSVQQGGPQMNKHYYGNNNAGPRGHHGNNQIEQHKSSNIEKDPNNAQQEMTVKEDNSND